MKRLILILFVLMIIVPMTTVMAAKNTVRYSRDTYYVPENYATIKIGAFMPNEDALDDGVGVSGAIGHMINKNFALELGLDYTFTDFNNDNDYYYENANVYTFGIPATAKFIVPLSNQIDLFAGAGLGIYFTSVVFDHHGYYYHDGYYYDDDDSIDDTSLGYHGLIGADIKVNSNMAIEMELKYTETEDDFDYYDYNFEVGGTTVSIGAKFLF